MVVPYQASISRDLGLQVTWHLLLFLPKRFIKKKKRLHAPSKAIASKGQCEDKNSLPPVMCKLTRHLERVGYLLIIRLCKNMACPTPPFPFQVPAFFFEHMLVRSIDESSWLFFLLLFPTKISLFLCFSLEPIVDTWGLISGRERGERLRGFEVLFGVFDEVGVNERRREDGIQVKIEVGWFSWACSFCFFSLYPLSIG